MSRSGPSLPAQGPVLSDVARLWSHLTTEWVTDLEIRLEPGYHSDGTPFIQMSLVSWRLEESSRAPVLRAWAARRFTGVDYRGSYNQLYDLLIVGFREIERKLLPLEREA